LILEAARQGHGAALQGAAPALRRDADFVLSVVQADPAAVAHASEELLHDKRFALRAVASAGRALQHLPNRLRADRDVVEAAVGENAAAALFAHSARRAEMGIDLPWDGSAALTCPELAAGVMEEAQLYGGKQMLFSPEDLPYRRHKLQKSVQFSAFSVMFGNMGQTNYTAANIMLDKLPAIQRPTVDAVTLMWGAVGGIGMRWKAFASADFLNATPDALLSIDDSAKCLFYTTCKMNPPEWYSCGFVDEGMRQALCVPCGAGTGGGYIPSEAALAYPNPFKSWRSEGLDGLKKGFLSGGLAANGAPLGGWPGLVGMQEPAAPQQQQQAAPEVPQQRPSYPLEVGALVELVGLDSKNGATGVLVKSFSDGRWKVCLEPGSGNALLREHYLQVLLPASEVAKHLGTAPELQAGASAAELRRAKADERRNRLRERALAKEANQQQIAVGGM